MPHDGETDNRPHRVVIVGFGDIGRRVARLWQARGVPVAALARHGEAVEAQRALGVEPLEADLDQPESLLGLDLHHSWIGYFAPPQGKGEGDQRMAHFVAALESMPQPPERILYISTSGVYGDRGGEWVRESDPVNPQTARAQRRWDAEQRLSAWGVRHGVPVVILRVGGIYGDGRLPMERLLRGEPVLKEAESGFTNRIHADDLASACVLGLERGEAGVVNVSDNRPGTMTQYFKAVAEAVGLPQPVEIDMATAEAHLSPAMLSYLTESRRLDSSKLLEEWGLRLTYPTLEAGLRQAVAALP